MDESLKFKISQGANDVKAERVEGDAWYIMATKAGHVVQRYQMPIDAAEVDVFASMRITLGAVRAGAV